MSVSSNSCTYPSLCALIPDYFNVDLIIALAVQLAAYDKISKVLIVDDSGENLYLQNQITILSNTKIKIISHSLNRGFAAALNTGFKYLIENNHRHCVVLNNDVQLSSHDINIIIGQSMNLMSSIIGFIDSSENTKCCKNNTYDISGFCFMLDLEILNVIGFLNESYFMYGEEQEFFYTAHHKNIKITQYPLSISHTSQQSSLKKSVKDWRSWLAIRNSILFSLNTKRPFKALKNIAYFYLLSFKLINKYDASSVRIQSIGPIKLSLYTIAGFVWFFLHTSINPTLAIRLNNYILRDKPHA